jgi:hypothetical protein
LQTISFAGERRLLLNIVHEDELGWCTVFTSNGRKVLVHQKNIVRLTPEEEGEIADGPGNARLDAVREKLPGVMLLFEAMQAEVTALTNGLAASE